MHDPLVVAWTVPTPWPRRRKYRDARPGDQRWTLGRRRRTNQENLGEPVYPWYRPKGYEPRVAGRCFGLEEFATIWHKEPGGSDSGTVCKHYYTRTDGTIKHTSAWKWHVHHWHITVRPTQALKRWVWSRCAKCGRRFPYRYSPVSHSWSGGGPRWFRGEPNVYHQECSTLVRVLGVGGDDREIVRQLFADIALLTGRPEGDLINELAEGRWSFRLRQRLAAHLGYSMDDRARWVPDHKADR